MDPRLQREKRVVARTITIHIIDNVIEPMTEDDERWIKYAVQTAISGRYDMRIESVEITPTGRELNAVGGKQ